MKCAHCNSDLSAFGAMGSKFSHCPFCGKNFSRSTAPEKPGTIAGLEDALQEIVRMDGKDALQEGKRVMSLVRDIAPGLAKRDMSMLRAFLECEGSRIFWKWSPKPGVSSLSGFRSS